MNKLNFQNTAVPLIIFGVLSMLIVPFTPLMLDIMFSINISLTLIVLIVVANTEKPLDFSIFPKLLLIATILRLGLNVASTRVILVNGHTGSSGAGEIINAFGSFVVGGNFAVGIIVFAILTLISLMVITKGAERISEVKARFSLDSLPGSQMSIDADLNAGAITQEEASERRKNVSLESQFFGSMDGASKFVKGDAYVSIVILFINIIGGFIIGMVQHGMEMSKAISSYTILSIGDGLVAQIPSILMAIATAMMISGVTGKSKEEGGLGELLRHKAVFYTVAGVMLIVGVMPGMPILVFWALAGAIAYVAYQYDPSPVAVEEPAKDVASDEVTAPSYVVQQSEIKIPNVITLKLGLRLTTLVKEGSHFMGQVYAVRKELSKDLGFVVKGVNVHESTDLDANEYSIEINGVECDKGVAWPSLKFAFDLNGTATSDLRGKEAIEPVYQAKGYWIRKEDTVKARGKGYTVTDAETLVTTHLREVLINNAAKIIKTDDVTAAVDRVKAVSSELANLVTKKFDHVTILNVFKVLLDERVSILPVETIFESMANQPEGAGYRHLAEMCRKSLSEYICQDLINSKGELPVMTLPLELQNEVAKSLQNGALNLTGKMSSELFGVISNGINTMKKNGDLPVLLVADQLRPGISDIFVKSIPDLSVVSPSEITHNAKVSHIEI